MSSNGHNVLATGVVRKGQAVVVTTDQKGVFFGYAADDYPGDTDFIVLEKVRNCIYWANTVKGFLGLTATGPNKACRVGPPCPLGRVRGVTMIGDVTPEAIRAWESAPWSS